LFPVPDGKNGWFVHSPVAGTAKAADANDVAALACTGATTGAPGGLGTPAAQASLSVAGDGAHDIGCTATDAAGNTGTGASSAKIDTTAPVVHVTFPAPDGKNGWFVSSPVAGSASGDDANGIAALTCTGAAAGAVEGLGTPSAHAPLSVSGDGTHDVACTAADVAGNSGDGSASLKIDATPPAVACSASPGALWPPNHKLVDVTTTFSVDGGASGSAGAILESATSSEPDNGLGDGDVPNDIQGWTIGTADTAGQLRAERAGTGPGRVYTLTYMGADSAGNTSDCAAAVKIAPHDQSP